jgi:hypothetical protein
MSPASNRSRWLAALTLGTLLLPTMLLTSPAAAAPIISDAVRKPLVDAQKALLAKDWPTVLAKTSEAAANPKKKPYDQHIIDEWQGYAYANTGDWVQAAPHFEATLNDGFITAGADTQARLQLTVQSYYNSYVLTREADKARAGEYLDKVILLGNKAIAKGANAEFSKMVVNAYYIKEDYLATAKLEQQLVDSELRQGQTPTVEQLDMLRSAYYKGNDDDGLFNAFKLSLQYHPTPELREQAAARWGTGGPQADTRVAAASSAAPPASPPQRPVSTPVQPPPAGGQQPDTRVAAVAPAVPPANPPQRPASIPVQPVPLVAAQISAPPVVQLDADTWYPVRRLALVIGNSSYGGPGSIWPDLEGGPLKDAEAMSALLRRLGFEVILAEDQDLDQMTAKLRELSQRIQAAQDPIVFFYYSGHGAQAPRTIDGEGQDNYLIPVHTSLSADVDAHTKALSLTDVRGVLRHGKAAVVVLDACRDNLLRRASSRGALTRGLQGGERSSEGMLVAFSTAAGEVAPNRPGQMSLYTELLVRELARPAMPLAKVFKVVRKQVAEQGGRATSLPELDDETSDEIVLVKP